MMNPPNNFSIYNRLRSHWPALFILIISFLVTIWAYYTVKTSAPLQEYLAWMVLFSGCLVSGVLFVSAWYFITVRQNSQYLQTEITERISIEEQLRSQLASCIQELAATKAQWQQEIQDREQVEKSLRATEERFELAMRGANDGLWDWDLQTNEAYFSPRWKQMLGFADEELSNHFDEWHKRLHPYDFDKVMLGIDAYLEHRVPSYESLHRMKHKDGRYIWVLVRGLALWNDNGEPLRFVGTHVDMTAQKEAEAALRESEQYRRTLIEESLIGLVLVDMEGQIKEINPAYANIVGYTVAELCQLRLQDIIPAKYINLVNEQLALVKTTGRLGPIEKEYLHRDGHLVPIRWSGLIIKIKGQDLIWCYMEDITAQKRAEHAEKAKIEAELANRAKSAFLANMSHELRTPLNGILGYAQILATDNNLTVHQQEGVKIIRQCGEYLLTLINDILDISKIETGDFKLYPADFHFGDFIKHLTQLFQIRAEEKGISFVYEPLSHLPVGAYADEKRLRQILVHLLSNAVKFTNKGGVTFKVNYHEGKICFEVEDTGIGMTPADLEKIFSPFQQVSKQTTYKVEGLGVGLPITQKLVALMKGEIQVESTPGHGSLFRVILDLPEIPGLVKPTTEPAIIIGFEGQPRTLLVIDDKWENRLMLTHLLKPLGFEILEAGNGQEGLDKVHEVQPDLILTDLVMPVMDGFELARHIRKIPEIAYIPIIALSASVLEAEQEESLLVGCNHCLTKPIHAPELLNTLQKYLDLVWIYEKAEVQEFRSSEVQEDLQVPSDLVGPSSEEAAELYPLTFTEELGTVVAAVEELERSNPQLTPFADLIRQSAKEFKEEQICQLIERFL
jgi:PAS domain S-box-containing protein